jgi:hypothetical protein
MHHAPSDENMVQNGSKILRNPIWIELIVQRHTPVALAPKRGPGKSQLRTFEMPVPKFNYFKRDRPQYITSRNSSVSVVALGCFDEKIAIPGDTGMFSSLLFPDRF